MTAWSVLVLRSAQDFSLAVDPRAKQRIGAWLDSLVDATTGLTEPRPYLTRPQSRAVPTVTQLPPVSGAGRAAAALLCRVAMEPEPHTIPAMHIAATSLLARLPARSHASEVVDAQAQLFAALALMRLGGEQWTQRSEQLAGQLSAAQRRDGNFAGSWDPDQEAVGKLGGRIVTTALAELTLQACYRYTALVR